METFQNHKKIFLFVGIFIVVAIIYELFFSGGGAASSKTPFSPTADGLVSEIQPSSSDAIVGRDLLALLAQLQTISLDTSVFTNPVFVSLQDWSRPIDPQPFSKAQGRQNPFSDFNKSAAVPGVSNPSNIPAN